MGVSGKQISIQDVARAAGVSPGTVSNTLNHPDRVAPTTRARVRETIEQLGFIPSQAGRVLGGAPSRVIALVMLDYSPFYMELASAVERAVRESGHVVMLCHSENDRDKEKQLLRMLNAQGVRGALVSPASGRDPVSLRAQSTFPVVFLDNTQVEGGCAVAVDDVEGGRAAAEHLIGLGHRRIAFVGGPADLQQMQRRAEGIRVALTAAGLDPTTTMRQVNTDQLGFNGGGKAVQLLMDDDAPTGVIFGNDLMAFGFYRGLVENGLRVPEDVSLIGYDDISFAAEWVVPLTSIRQPIHEVGRCAAELLLKHSTGDPAHEHKLVHLSPTLEVRKSTAAPRASWHT